MPTVKPDHSISEVVFVIKFSQLLSEKSLQSLMELHEQLKDDLPKMESQAGAGLRVKPDGQFEPQSPRLVTIAFKHFNNTGEFDWALRAEGNYIAVNCLDYSGGWEKVWPKVRNYLNLAARKLISTENLVESITLQYVDRFIYEGQIDWYKTSIVFNDESLYLNKKVTSAGAFWHIHQGWFDSIKELPVRVLNTLNMTAAMADKEHHTTIDHNATIQFKQSITNHKTLFSETIKGNTAIDFYFDLLHKKNKQTLSELLNEERISDIKLT